MYIFEDFFVILVNSGTIAISLDIFKDQNECLLYFIAKIIFLFLSMCNCWPWWLVTLFYS